MSAPRRYPMAETGPFPAPPATSTDREGREIVVDFATNDDLEGLVDMYATFDPAQRAQGIPPAHPERIEPWLKTVLDDGVHIIASHDGCVIAHAMLVPDSDGSHELAIFVHQDYQGAGNGRTLIRHLLGAAQVEAIEHIWLTVERWNLPALELYKSVGFETVQADRFDLEMAMSLPGS